MLAGKLETAEAAVHIYSTTAVPKNVKFTGYCKIHMHYKVLTQPYKQKIIYNFELRNNLQTIWQVTKQ